MSVKFVYEMRYIGMDKTRSLPLLRKGMSSPLLVFPPQRTGLPTKTPLVKKTINNAETSASKLLVK